ncbi:cytochrome c4 [Advenella alkanexedens]|uniref:Cytochrome c4 n=1 Tax=Advenella alkanexedens TaxID=1481665 RepID=A0ABS6NLP3_9BURK|nr:c-type cytochrome [Advenella alkanexedens]MBV4396550.1 cytochrome c4 [Advenella alkanexedens]
MRYSLVRLIRAGAWVAGGWTLALPSAMAADTINAEAIARGKTVSATCVACHQANGAGMNLPQGESWPRLAGLNRDYMIAQLKAFKDGTRKNASMVAFASMLNDEQIADVASYYASLPVPEITPVAADAALLKRGEQLALQGDWERYIVSCKSCHGPGNQGNGADFPVLAGQQPAYIVQQIQAWKNGTRINDPQGLMASIAKRLDDNDTQAVAAWLAQQPVQEQK